MYKKHWRNIVGVDVFIVRDYEVVTSVVKNSSGWGLEILFIHPSGNSRYENSINGISHPAKYWQIAKLVRFLDINPINFNWQLEFLGIADRDEESWKRIVGERIYQNVINQMIPEEIIEEMLEDPKCKARDFEWMLEKNITPWREEFFEKKGVLGPNQKKTLKEYQFYIDHSQKRFPFDEELISRILLKDSYVQMAKKKLTDQSLIFLTTLCQAWLTVRENYPPEKYSWETRQQIALGYVKPTTFEEMQEIYLDWVVELAASQMTVNKFALRRELKNKLKRIYNQ